MVGVEGECIKFSQNILLKKFTGNAILLAIYRSVPAGPLNEE